MFGKTRVNDPYNTMSAPTNGTPRKAKARRADPAKVQRLVQAGDELTATERANPGYTAARRSAWSNRERAANAAFDAAAADATPDEYDKAWRQLSRRHGRGHWPR